MRALYLSLLLSLGAICASAQVVHIPDTNFLQALIDHRPTVDQNGDGMIQVSEAEIVDSLYLRAEGITDLTGIASFLLIRYLNVSKNDLTTLDVTQNANLESLECSENELSELDVTQNANLEELDCGRNDLTALDVTQNVKLEGLDCYYNSLTTLDVTQNPNLEGLGCHYNSLMTLDVTQNPNLEWLYCSANDLTTLDVTQNPNLKELDCSVNNLSTLDVSQNPNLEGLFCPSNFLTTLDVTQNPNLGYLICFFNNLSELVVFKNTKLERLDCGINQMSTLDVSQMPRLSTLYCDSNQLNSLDVVQNPSLQTLYCAHNQLSMLDVSQNAKLQTLYCDHNQLSMLDVSQNAKLQTLYCDHNQLSMLDVSQNAKLQGLGCGDNNLISLDVSNNPLITKIKYSNKGLYLSSEDSIRYICAHPNNLAEIQRELEEEGLNETVVSLFCSYDDLVAYRPIVALGDDCSAEEYGDQVPMRVIVGLDTVDFFYTGLSDLYLPETADTIYINPASVDTTLYTLIEDEIKLDSSTLASGLDADSIYLDTLCAEVKVMVYDLVSHVIPTTIARPGFLVRYKLIYENRGTETISGSVGFGYDGDVLTYVDASVVEDQDLGDSLVWDFVDLRPFERREIMITMRLNSPMDAPPLNDGDILTYHVCAMPTADDHRPEDNCTTLAQTVRNAYDPNDKRCMQGEQLTPDGVGGYLTYMIRFENTGSAEAVNIRVTDEIDTDVFDISTLTPVDASHPYHIEIHKGNEVHFVFPNIYLPYDDANNDGYITFRIKTKDDLIIGDEVKNSASIFFDYNFPIYTNTATTEITDFVSVRPTDGPDIDLSIYPNPSSDFIQLEAEAPIHHILISDAAGRVTLQHNYDGSDERIQLSLKGLSSGSYQVKVYTAMGSAIQTLVIRD